jgi:hypothetical protein
VTVNMLFKENITTKEQMVNWLNKRRPAYSKGETLGGGHYFTN